MFRYICKSDGNSEFCPFALLTLNFYVTVHQIDYILGDRHSESGTAVPAGRRRVLLRECIKYMRQVLLTHADAGIFYRKSESSLVIQPGRFLNCEDDAATGRCELHGISEDIDQDLSQLDLVSDVAVIDPSDKMAFIIDALVSALTADYRIDMFKRS